MLEYSSSEDSQVYVSLQQPPSSPNMSVPLQELKAFQRVPVPVASVVTCVIHLPVADLQLVGPDGKPTVLPGLYYVWVGGVSPKWNTPYTLNANVAAPMLSEFLVV